MKRQHFLVGAFLTFALTQPLTSQENEPRVSSPTCGTESAMKKMPAELKILTEASAAAVQADELLLYINFNPNGSVVRPGFGSADNMTSAIITSTRFLPPPTLNEEQREEIVKLVSDDFSPFNIRITTDAAEFAAHPRFNKQMVLISTFPSVAGFGASTAGVSPFAGLGLRLPGDFAFAFSSASGNDPTEVAFTISHETAHLLGLDHQHLFTDSCGYVSEYHPGFGSGPLAFNPLMGFEPLGGIDNWFAQSCQSPFSGLPHNDYELINSQVVARPDDFPDGPGGNIVDAPNISGILERAGDVDFVKINFKDPGPVVVTSDNIDLKVYLVSPGGYVYDEFNDPDSTSATIPSAQGVRYLKIEASSNDNMAAQFMTGTYRVSY